MNTLTEKLNDAKTSNKDEEKRLNTIIRIRKYQLSKFDPDTHKFEKSGESYVDVYGKLVELSEATYLEKVIYKDYKISRAIDRQDAYIDRMHQWDPKKFNECRSKLENKIANGRTVQGLKVKDIELFLTLYNGYPCRLSMITENTGYDGYDYTYLEWVKVSDLEEYAEKSTNNTNKRGTGNEWLH